MIQAEIFSRIALWLTDWYGGATAWIKTLISAWHDCLASSTHVSDWYIILWETNWTLWLIHDWLIYLPWNDWFWIILAILSHIWQSKFDWLLLINTYIYISIDCRLLCFDFKVLYLRNYQDSTTFDFEVLYLRNFQDLTTFDFEALYLKKQLHFYFISFDFEMIYLKLTNTLITQIL